MKTSAILRLTLDLYLMLDYHFLCRGLFFWIALPQLYNSSLKIRSMGINFFNFFFWVISLVFSRGSMVGCVELGNIAACLCMQKLIEACL